MKHLTISLILLALFATQKTFSQPPATIPPAEVINPYIPTEMTFAGRKISLSRADLHERLDRELITFTYGHTTTMMMLKRANRYFPVIEPILKECGVPDDLKYLMIIESSGDIWALSPAKAAGLWQFMPNTAKEYGLEVNNNVDERYHVEKATRAACDYLKEAYEKYGDWLTVAASYNAGQHRISEELGKQQADNALDLWLNRETARYMFRILAAKQLFSNPKAYGFILRSRDLYPVLPTQPLEITSTITNLGTFARKHGVPMSLLKEANPWLRSNTLPVRAGGKSYTIQIPVIEKWTYDPASTIPHNHDWIVK